MFSDELMDDKTDTIVEKRRLTRDFFWDLAKRNLRACAGDGASMMSHRVGAAQMIERFIEEFERMSYHK